MQQILECAFLHNARTDDKNSIFMTKRFLFFTLLLTIVTQGVWGGNYEPTVDPKINKTEGPWTYEAVKVDVSMNGSGNVESFNSLTRISWDSRDDGTPITYFWNNDNGIGFLIHCISYYASHYGVMSTYTHDELVPAYTRKRMTWRYSLLGQTNYYPQNVALYACNDLSTLKAASVDFTAGYWGYTGSPYYLAHLQTNNPKRTKTSANSGVKTAYFDFDNRSGSAEQTKQWALLLVHVTEENEYRTHACHQWGSFRHEGISWQTFYYKQITYNANNGEGTMDSQEIETSGNLTPNAFTRTGYDFVGWATTPDGAVEYTDGAEIKAEESDKGSVTLYAKWVSSAADVIALIDAIGEVAYTSPCKAKIDAARTAYNDLTPEKQPQVTNYATLQAAEAEYGAIDNVVKLISQVGLFITYTPECKAKIDAARAAYDALSPALQSKVVTYFMLLTAERLYDVYKAKALIAAIPETIEKTEECYNAIVAAQDAYIAVYDKKYITATELKKLQAAVNAYAVLDGKSTIRFVDKDEEPIRDQVLALDYPEAPKIATYTFRYWQVAEKNISDGTIRLQAVYTKDVPTGIDDANANAKAKAAKLIRNGNLYILTDEIIFTVNGQRVK